jgi:methionyl-tRNA formyltransferase
VVTSGLRLVFFGTPEFAVPSLERLLASRHQVLAVVTRPDRPRGRGLHLAPSAVKAMAQRHGVPALQPERLKDEAFLERLAAFAPDCGIVAAYGKILPEAVLAIPPLGLLNVHASLLPRYRGAAPIERAIMAGESETGVTIMRVVRELDAGPTYASAGRPIGPDETGAEVERALAELGAGLLLEVLGRLEPGLPAVPQDDSRASYAPRITREDGLIDWPRPGRAIHDQVRALHPWPHAFTFVGGERLIVLRTACAGSEREELAPAPPGTVVEASGDRIRVATGTVPIDLVSLQLEGRRPMAPREFLAGHRLRPGVVLGRTPPTSA